MPRGLASISSGALSPEEPGRFAPLVHALLDQGDQYMLLADFPAYVECQERVEAAYRSEATWTRMSILNVAHMGRFSSDATVRAYAEEIWGAKSAQASIAGKGPKRQRSG